jgi:cell division protein YceG involved in septum cleavage
MKKQLIIGILLLLLVGLVGGALVYRQRKARWQEYKKNVENQKAEEITIRIIEGWSNQEIAEYLDKQGIVTADIFLKSTLNYPASEYKNQLPPEALTNLQGFLYPNTYRLFKSITNRIITSDKDAAQVVIKKLLTEFFNKLPNNAENLARQQGLSLYQAITLASIIEKETGRGGWYIRLTRFMANRHTSISVSYSWRCKLLLNKTLLSCGKYDTTDP